MTQTQYSKTDILDTWKYTLCAVRSGKRLPAIVCEATGAMVAPFTVDDLFSVSVCAHQDGVSGP